MSGTRPDWARRSHGRLRSTMRSHMESVPGPGRNLPRSSKVWHNAHVNLASAGGDHRIEDFLAKKLINSKLKSSAVGIPVGICRVCIPHQQKRQSWSGQQAEVGGRWLNIASRAENIELLYAYRISARSAARERSNPRVSGYAVGRANHDLFLPVWLFRNRFTQVQKYFTQYLPAVLV